MLRVRETAHGLGFALVVLGLAILPLAGWPFPGGYAVAAVLSGALLLGFSGSWRPTGSETWSRDRVVGFFGGSTAFWFLFVLAGSSAGAFGLEAVPAEPAVAGVHAGEAEHTFRMDPSRYVANGAPSLSLGPPWPVPPGTRNLQGTLQWEEGSGLTRLQATLEVEGPAGWVDLGRWSLAPGQAFNATMDGGGPVRLTVRPTSANPSFDAVDVAATVTFLAKAP